MAKFRMNHARQGKGGVLNTRTILLIGVIAAVILWQSPDFLDRFLTLEKTINGELPESEVEDYTAGELFFIPRSDNKNIVKHQHYALAYNEKHELADWVAYELTRAQLQQNRVDRADNFRSDPKVKTKSADLYDYRGSGYDRGHLLPVADRKFSFEAMDETFYLSNIAPQVRQFNGGIWRELEELTRDWAYKFNKIYVVTGPVLSEQPIKKIGKNKVSVPAAFYKVILDIAEPEFKGIGFIIPNAMSDAPVKQFAVSIDEVERKTDIDFFPELLDEELEKELEANFNTKNWPFNERKYQLRVDKWNKR